MTETEQAEISPAAIMELETCLASAVLLYPFTDKKVTAYTAYANDAVIRLTKAGIDLAEGTVEDLGVGV